MITLLSAVVLTSCVTLRNFRLPSDRPRVGTPYTLPQKDVEIGLKILDQEEADMAVYLGVRVGITDKFEMGANLAHAALGILNVDAKLNLIDRKWWALSARTGVIWMHAKTVWALPDDIRTALGDIDIVAVPVELCVGSIPFKWLGIHLAVGYLHGALFGNIQTDTVVFDGSVGTRKLYVMPQVNLFALDSLNIFVRANLPALLYYYEETNSEVTETPGYAMGVRSAEWTKLDNPLRMSQVTFGFDIKFGRYTRAALFAVYRGALSRADVVSTSVMPGAAIFIRF